LRSRGRRERPYHFNKLNSAAPVHRLVRRSLLACATEPVIAVGCSVTQAEDRGNSAINGEDNNVGKSSDQCTAKFTTDASK